MDYTPDYEKDKAPNENDLIGDWLRQSFIYDFYANKYKTVCNELLDKKENMRLAKEKYEYVRSKIDLKIRKNPEDFGFKKLTEKTIESIINTNNDVLKAQENFNIAKKFEIDTQKKVNLLKVAEVTIGEQKKKSLEELTKAFYLGFFGEPKIGGNNFVDRVKTRLREREKSK
jgi:hypothetical protein